MLSSLSSLDGGGDKAMTSEEDLQFCTRQILRLAMMYNFPSKSQPAIEDLAAALMKAETRAEAEAVITGLKDGATAETRCPMESEIKAAIHARIVATQGEWLPDPECSKCRGSGAVYDETKTPARYMGDCNCFARRQPPDYSKMKRDRSMQAEVAAAANKLKVQ